MERNNKPIRVIINADDLGNSKVSNDIIYLLKKGIITSATLIANGPVFEDVISRLSTSIRDRIGVHLNLTDHKPLTANANLEPLLDENGEFCRKIFSIKFTAKVKDAIFHEFCAQIDKIRSCGIKISHIDSHEHIHIIPGLFMVLKNVQKKYGIYKVRNTRNIYQLYQSYRGNLYRKIRKNVWQFALRNFLKTTTTDCFTDFLTFYKFSQIYSPKYDTIELMVHPGNSDHSEETKLLCTDWVSQLPFKVSLIDYNSL